MNRYIKSSIVLLILGCILEWFLPATSIWIPFKYICIAYGITLIVYGIAHSYIHKRNQFVAGLGILILIIFTILLVDTYWIHALDWFPGIVRYALFSAYIPGYLLFILPGICLCYKD